MSPTLTNLHVRYIDLKLALTFSFLTRLRSLNPPPPIKVSTDWHQDVP